MAVQAVHIEGDAFLVCVAHSLSTEREEVMGLCIGEVRPVSVGDGGLRATGGAVASAGDVTAGIRQLWAMAPVSVRFTFHTYGP